MSDAQRNESMRSKDPSVRETPLLPHLCLLKRSLKTSKVREHTSDTPYPYFNGMQNVSTVCELCL